MDASAAQFNERIGVVAGGFEQFRREFDQAVIAAPSVGRVQGHEALGIAKEDGKATAEGADEAASRFNAEFVGAPKAHVKIGFAGHASQVMGDVGAVDAFAVMREIDVEAHVLIFKVLESELYSQSAMGARLGQGMFKSAGVARQSER